MSGPQAAAYFLNLVLWAPVVKPAEQAFRDRFGDRATQLLGLVGLAWWIGAWMLYGPGSLFFAGPLWVGVTSVPALYLWVWFPAKDIRRWVQHHSGDRYPVAFRKATEAERRSATGAGSTPEP
jgi:hypothetical protein